MGTLTPEKRSGAGEDGGQSAEG